MLSEEMRRQFLSYFKERGHTLVPSSPVVPHDDPTLLFINAGMNQFKDVFLGKSRRDYTKAVSSQKCIRVGGKHNDLENVGHTSRHLTFFEMLGNFSFGDYFKKEAIAFAWEATLDVFGFDPAKLWATVFYEDEESFELWKAYLPEERIVRMGEKDNFWAMGDVGPCGPCSELYFDKGEIYGSARSPAEDIEGNRFLEFWNLVFMQSNRDASGKIDPLPKPSVDTGAGLERLVAIKMGAESLFETDILRSLIAEVENLSGKTYEAHGKSAPAFHVIADHVRSLAFAISDGVQPSNIERGYVLRKVLRRAVRYGRTLGFDAPFLGKVFPRLQAMMSGDFPELNAHAARIEEILATEEEAFLRTLRRGGQLLSQIIASSHKHGDRISGDDAFKLKDTYGLPLDEILLIANDADLSVDIPRFEELEGQAKEKSRQARKETVQAVSDTTYEAHLKKHGPCTFLGYSQLTADDVIIGLMKEGKEVETLYAGEEGAVLLSRTPFYAEKGGQVGDQGVLSSERGRFQVADCQSPYTDVILHLGVVESGELHLSDAISASVDAIRRQHIANNHTATHLVHTALTEVLGSHVKQAGSVVDALRLRFDFHHHKALSPEEICQIEDRVNALIRENIPVATFELSFEEAQKRQEIKQFFGDKYGSRVRVVDIAVSKELCGGTHTSQTGNIGYFKIAKESSIAAGIRRLEAVTGAAAENLARTAEQTLETVASTLKTPIAKLRSKVESMTEENAQLATELKRLKKDLLAIEVENLLAHVEEETFLVQAVPMDPKELRTLADLLMTKRPKLALFLIAPGEKTCSLLTRVSPDLVTAGIRAHEWIQAVAPLVEGKGGGKADAAQAGGTAPENIPAALTKAREWIKVLI